MADSLEFRWELIDQVSRSATAIERSLAKAEAAMKRAQGTARGGSSSWAFMGLKMGAVAGVAGELTRGFLRLGEGAIRLGVSGVKYAIEAASFRENSLLALEAIMGSRSAAVQAMDAWSALSEKTPFDNREVQEWGKQLVVAGESLENSMTILKAAADLGTALGSTSEKRKAIGESFVEWAAGIKQLGSMADMRRLRELSQFGLSPQKAEQNLAARLTGGNIPALQKLMEQAKATGQDLSHEIVLAALQAAQDTYGKVGKLGAKGAGTLSGMFTKIDFDDLFKGLETTKGFGALKGVLRNIQELLDPRSASGKAIHDSMMELGNTLGEILKPLTGEEGRKNMTAFFMHMKTLIETVLPAAVKLGSAVIGFGARLGQGAAGVAGLVAGGNKFEQRAGAVALLNALGMTDTAATLETGAGNMVSPPATQGVPAMLARPSITVQTTVHVHGNTDSDNLVEKIDTQVNESMEAWLDRMGLHAGAQ